MEIRGFVETLADVRVWLYELVQEGGPNLYETAHVKLVHEAEELRDQPDDIEEWADVMICLMGVAVRNRWSISRLTLAVARKTGINRARTWQRQPDGSWQHT